MKRILIFGSNSCAGSGVVGDLSSKENFKILPTSRSSEREDFYLPYKWGTKPNVETFKKLDLNLQITELKEILNDFKPDYIINFASQSMVGESWDNPEDWMQTNVASFMKLIRVLHSYTGLQKYIHFSTPEVYGDTGSQWIKENVNFQPTTPYALSRACGDQIVRMWSENFGFPAIITRAANVYGPGQQLYRIIPKAIFSILSGQKIPLHGDGLSIRSFVHCTDIASALGLILHKGRAGESYHISPKEFISIADLVRLIASEMNADFDKIVEKSPDRRGKDQYYLLDSQKMNKLGWQPKVGLKQGIKGCISWVKENLHQIQNETLTYIHKK